MANTTKKTTLALRKTIERADFILAESLKISGDRFFFSNATVLVTASEVISDFMAAIFQDSARQTSILVK